MLSEMPSLTDVRKKVSKHYFKIWVGALKVATNAATTRLNLKRT